MANEDAVRPVRTKWHGTCLSAAANMLAANPTSTATRGYARRRPETTVLYGVVRAHLPTLLDHARDRSEHGFGYPRFVEREFEKFLACGLLCRGFVRVRCDSCAEERLVAFSSNPGTAATTIVDRIIEEKFVLDATQQSPLGSKGPPPLPSEQRSGYLSQTSRWLVVYLNQLSEGAVPGDEIGRIASSLAGLWSAIDAQGLQVPS